MPESSFVFEIVANHVRLTRGRRHRIYFQRKLFFSSFYSINAYFIYEILSFFFYTRRAFTRSCVARSVLINKLTLFTEVYCIVKVHLKCIYECIFPYTYTLAVLDLCGTREASKSFYLV